MTTPWQHEDPSGLGPLCSRIIGEFAAESSPTISIAPEIVSFMNPPGSARRGNRYSRKWTWQFEQPAEALWPLIADTARFNEALKTPKYLVEEIPQADGSMLRLARARIGPIRLEWEEHPFEWVINRCFTQTRVFRKGPFRTFGPRFQIAPSGAGSRASYEVRVEPANVLGRLLLLCGFMRRTGALIDPLMRGAGRFAAGMTPQIYSCTPPPLSAGARARIEAITARLESGPY